MSTPTTPWKPGQPKDCQHGHPDRCRAAKFDGLPCKPGECDIAAGNRQDRPEPPRAGRSLFPTKTRHRKARWEVTVGDVRWKFAFDPASNLIVVRKYGCRKSRTITAAELLSALDGQKLLPL